MSLTDKKVSDALLQTGVVSAPDRLTGTAAENKAVFDRLMRNVAQSVINPVIDELVGIEGADNIGTPAGSVRQRLDSASDHIANQGNPHNVTPVQIGAETPVGAQSKANEALSQAKQYAETEVRKHIAQSGAVIADGMGNAENANALNGIPGENYLPEKITDLTGKKSYEYAAPMACVARPAFVGRTVQEETPSPNTPAPVKGVLNPWFAAYSGGPVEVPAGVEPLMALPDGTADRIVLRDGVWGIERNAVKFVLDGSKNYILSSQPENLELALFYTTDLMSKIDLFPYGSCMSDKFGPPIIWDEENFHVNGGPVPQFTVKKSRLTGWSEDLTNNEKAALFKNWISENPVTCYSRLNKPVFEPVPAWNNFGKIDPITVTTTITKPNPDAPISPDNVATITGTPVVTTGYRGQVRQLMEELFDGDSFDGVNVVKRMKNWQITEEHCSFFVTTWATSPEIIAFCGKLPANFCVSPTVVKCNTFILEGANDTETIQTQGGFKVLYLFIKKSRLADWSDSLPDEEKVAALENWLNENPVHLLYELNAPVITRHNMDLVLSPGAYAIEAGDENGLLESVSIEVLPDSSVYGRKVYPYQHVKEGTVHKLTGTSGAGQIIFNATDIYQDGNTWTVNGAPVAVTYNDGQALLPTAVIAGDVVEAVIEGDNLRLMLQKPTPQKPVNGNVYFDVWQRGIEFSGELTPGFLYVADRWWNGYQADSTYVRVLNTSPAPCKYALRVQQSGDVFSWNIIWQQLEDYEKYLDCDLTVSYWIKPLGKIKECNVEILGTSFTHGLKSNVWNLVVFTAKAGSYNTEVYKGLHIGTGLGSIQGDGYEITALKLEIGDRYTGDYIAKPGETLAECQRYLLMGPLQANRLSAAHAFLSTPTAMRIAPSIIGSPGVYLISDEQQIKATVSVHDITHNGVTLNVTGATEPCFVYFPPGSGLSAEL